MRILVTDGMDKTAMAQLREAADSMELVVAKDYWPFPVYSDLLFSV